MVFQGIGEQTLIYILEKKGVTLPVQVWWTRTNTCGSILWSTYLWNIKPPALAGFRANENKTCVSEFQGCKILGFTVQLSDGKIFWILNGIIARTSYLHIPQQEQFKTWRMWGMKFLSNTSQTNFKCNS